MTNPWLDAALAVIVQCSHVIGADVDEEVPSACAPCIASALARAAAPRPGVEEVVNAAIAWQDAPRLNDGHPRDRSIEDRLLAALNDYRYPVSPPPAPRPSVPHVYEAHACGGPCPCCNLCLTHECRCPQAEP